MTTPIAATRVDVEDLLGRDLTDDADRVDRLLVRAEGIVAGDLVGFTFEAGTETATVYGDGDDWLILPKYPVTSVDSVTVNGVALTAVDYRLDGELGRLRRLNTSVLGLDPAAVRWPELLAVEVVYSYGYASATAVPPTIAAVVAELAAARINNPEQVVQESTGDRSHSYATAAGAGDDLTAGQRHRLRHWRRNRYGTIRVRS